jgi:hypothetical protein
VLITNIAYDRIGTDFPEWNYTISLSRSFRNPKWSAFVENQGIQSDRYSDILFRGGIAHLFSENFQADISLGGSIKSTPSRIFGGAGLSYRLNYHKDTPIAIEDQNSKNIKRNSMKRKQKKSRKKGKGAEDIILDPPR